MTLRTSIFRSYFANLAWIIIFYFFLTGVGNAGLCSVDDPSSIHYSPYHLPRKIIIKGVPYVEQKDRYCGPAALAMILGYYGERISQRTLGVMKVRARGITVKKIINLARDRGFSAIYFQGDFVELKKQIAYNHPLYLSIKPDIHSRFNHAIVLVGYDDIAKKIFYHDPSEGKEEKMSYKKFLKYWEAAGWACILITPEKFPESK